jgi:PilZ domain
MADSKRPDGRPDRRRVQRSALSISATLREGSKSKMQVRVIDISTHGCRIECPSTVGGDSGVWLNIPSLEAQYCGVVWQCHEFIGLEFEKPLAQAVFDKLLSEQNELPEKTIGELRDMANRTHSLATQADIDDIHILAELSRKCAVDAVVEGFKRSQPKRAD